MGNGIHYIFREIYVLSYENTMLSLAIDLAAMDNTIKYLHLHTMNPKN